jgi:hypothetical protein
MALCCLVAAGAVLAQERELKDTSGTEFVLAFQPNYYNVSTLSLFIAAQENAEGTVEIPGLGFSTTFTVQAGQVTTVTVPDAAKNLPNNQVSNLGIRVSATGPVHVYGLNRQTYTTDAFQGLPAHVLGTDYLVMSYYGLLGSQLAVIGVEDNTEVTITPSVKVGNRPAGQPFTITLNRLQTFQLGTSGTDLTGTSVVASAPVAVTSGVQCAFVPQNVGACDHIVDMMPPLTAWGKDFLTYPLATRKKGDYFRVLASRDGTELRINGETVAILNAGAYFDRILTTPSRIEATAPVLLAQYSVGSTHDNVEADPFMMLVPPSEQFLKLYTFTTPATGFNNFVNIVIPLSAVESLRLDGSPLDAALFNPIGESGYSGAQIPLQAGSHNIEAEQPLGIYVYGFAYYDSYGYAGGMAVEVINPIHGDYRNVRVVSTIATNGIQLEPTSFTLAPERVEEFSDRIEIEWRFDAFSIGQVQDLDFELILRDPVPGEKRLVSHSLELVYDDINGNEHRRHLGEQRVAVLPSVYRLDLALDKTIYVAGDSGTVLPVIANMGVADGVVDLALDIQDATGHHVATLLASSGIAVAAGEEIHPAPGHFDTAGLYAGDYRVVARLVEPDGRATTASADFRVTVPSGQGLAASVAADLDSYSPLEQATLTGRLRNTAPNMQIEDHSLRLRVLAPGGGVFWETEAPLRSLAPGAVHDLSHILPLGVADAGIYRVELTALDRHGVAAAFAESAFRVLSSTETGAGLAGQVHATPEPMLRTEAVDLSAEIANVGNDAFHGLPLTLSLVDPEGAREVASWSEVVDLPRGGARTLAGRWIADLPGGTVLFAVLSAEIDGQLHTIARRAVRVEEKLVSTPLIDGRGRLLVLLDPPADNHCRKVKRLRFALKPHHRWRHGDRLELTLRGAGGHVLDYKSIHVGNHQKGDASPNGKAGLALAELSDTGLLLDIAAEEGGSLDGEYQVSATLHQDGQVIRFDSSPVHAGCGKLPKRGHRCGDFDLDDADTDTDTDGDGSAEPSHVFLEQLLREHGWSYTIVTHDNAFARELRGGGYSGYLLLSSDVHLDVQVQSELRERVFGGGGIVMAGVHDQRNHHLLDVTGVRPIGIHSHTDGIQPVSGAALEAPDAAFAVADKPLALRLTGAAPLAEYRVGKGRPHDRTAIALHTYGNGRSVIAGFDLLAQARAAGLQSGYAVFLLTALEHVHPTPIVAHPGVAVPFLWQVNNRGAALTAQLQLEIGGTRIADPGPATFDGPTSLRHVMNLPQEEADRLRLWWQLPETQDKAWIAGKLAIAEGVVFNEYGISLHSVPLEPLPGFDDVRARIDAIPGKPWRYAGVLRELEHAEHAADRDKPEQAVFHLLKAADDLAAIGGADADAARVMVAWLIHGIAKGI